MLMIDSLWERRKKDIDKAQHNLQRAIQTYKMTQKK